MAVCQTCGGTGGMSCPTCRGHYTGTFVAEVLAPLAAEPDTP
jgi:hypothetical protein